MDIEINEVQEIIKNLESSGELSIKEEKYLNVAKLCVQLATENVALNEKLDKLALWPGIEFYSSSWEFNNNDGNEAIEFMCDIETHATDRIVAGIKADGVEEFSKTLEGAADICGKSKAWEAQENLLDFAGRGFDFAKQLREGDNHD